jgi:hypothetical protein
MNSRNVPSEAKDHQTQLANTSTGAEYIQQLVSNSYKQNSAITRETALTELVALHETAETDEIAQDIRHTFLSLLKEEPKLLNQEIFANFLADKVEPDDFLELEWEAVILFINAENRRLQRLVEDLTDVELGDEGYQPLTYSEAIYWSIITASSTGYGDITPRTTTGRIIAAILGTIGVVTVGIFAGLVLDWLSPRRID